MSIGLMVCYARSGGTLLNKCLGVMPNTIVLSEVSVLLDNVPSARESSSQLFPSWQARNWYGINVSDSCFEAEVVELTRYCDANRKVLVIRDWSFLSFSKIPQFGNLPTLQLSTMKALVDVEIRPFAFVRNTIDVWISRGMPEIEEFANDYLEYAKAIISTRIPIFKYENFCVNPKSEMEKICKIIGIEFDEKFITSYANYHQVIGDDQVIGGSRGNNQQKIAALPQKRISDNKAELFHSNLKLKEANELLGYTNSPTKIESKIETSIFFARRLKVLYLLKRNSHFSKDSDELLSKKGLAGADIFLRMSNSVKKKSDYISLFAKYKHMLKEGSWILIGQAILLLGSLMGVKVMTGMLPTTEYGELALGMTMVSFANTVLLGPLVNGISRFYAPAQEQNDLGSYFNSVRRLTISATLVITLMLLLIMIGMLISQRTEWIQLVAASFVFSLFSGYNSILNCIQNAARQRKTVALHQGIEPWTRFAVAASCIMWLGAQSEVAMLGYAMSVCLVLSSQAIFFYKRFPQCETAEVMGKNWRLDILMYSWPFATWGIFVWVQQVSDRWALNYFSTSHEVGLFAVLLQLGYLPATMASTLAMQFLAPIFYQRAGDARDSNRNRHVSTLSWRLTMSVLLISAITFLLALLCYKQIFSIFVAKEYREVSYLWPWALLAGGVFAAGQTLALNLMSQMRTSRMTKAKIFTALLGGAINLLSAYYFGISGIVAASIMFAFVHLFWMAALTMQLDKELSH